MRAGKNASNKTPIINTNPEELDLLLLFNTQGKPIIIITMIIPKAMGK
jgi:hypothetical protein